MPPKSKFKREEVIEAAFQIVREEGIETLTARSLAARLNSSPRPIFTLFESMEEVIAEAKCFARERYNGYIERALKAEMPFKEVGTAYIRFAREEPKLFQLLFMTEKEAIPDRNNLLGVLDDSEKQILTCVQELYAFNKEEAFQVYLHLFLYSHGIATLIATKVCDFSDKEISEMLTAVCSSIILKMKRGC